MQLPSSLIETQLLDAIEKTHREAVGQQFCYVAVPSPNFRDHYVLGIARRTEHGFFPITEDMMIGSRQECQIEADKLNRTRLELTPREAALIVAGSLHDRHSVT